VQASGSGSGLAAYSAHVHPQEPGVFRVLDTSFLAWNYDPALVKQAGSPTSGTIYWIRVNVWQPITVANISVYLGALGSGLVTGNLLGLYTSAGSQIDVTADQTTNWGTGTANQVRTIPLAGGSHALATGSYYVALLANQSSGAVPTFGQISNFNANIANAGLSNSQLRWATNQTGTALPASFTPANLAPNAAQWWVALS
jgi:hypothetical protein